MIDVDIIVVGGGIVGSAFALLMGRRGANIVLIEPKPPATFADRDGYDHRVYAITPKNVALLDGLDTFNDADRSRLTPIQAMRIKANGDAHLEFSAREANRSDLATIVEHRLLAARLQQQISASQQIRLSAEKLIQVQQDDQHITATSANGEQWRAPLLVGADGGDSWVRNECGFATHIKEYEQFGLVANFRCERDHAHTARQWFNHDGVLAWLPLPAQCISIVWSVNAARATALLAMEAADFINAVAEVGDYELGAMQLISPIGQFPLRRQRAEFAVRGRIVLIGDAAHSVHPLAGQGLNLGLQDATVLAQNLGDKRLPEGYGDRSVLRRYERARAEPIAVMQTMTDGLQRLFSAESTMIAALRNNGLALTDRIGWLKKLLIREALG